MTAPHTYITTTIPYVNARPHIGFALELVQADVLARAGRGRGEADAFVALGQSLSLTVDDVIRTSRDPRHRPGVERFWRACEQAGDLYRSSTAAWPTSRCPGPRPGPAAGAFPCPATTAR